MGPNVERKLAFIPTLPRVRFSPRFLSLTLAAALLVPGCGAVEPTAVPTPKPVSTEFPAGAPLCDGDNGGGYFKDDGYTPSSDSVIQSIEFCFNRGRNNAVALRLCFTGTAGEFRIISRQVSQGGLGPGYLYNRPEDAPSERGCRVYSPVVEVEPDEMDQVNVGERLFTQDYDTTYAGRAYSTIRQGQATTLAVKYIGDQKIDPNSVIRRPDQPQRYFKR